MGEELGQVGGLEVIVSRVRRGGDSKGGLRGGVRECVEEREDAGQRLSCWELGGLEWGTFCEKLVAC